MYVFCTKMEWEEYETWIDSNEGHDANRVFSVNIGWVVCVLRLYNEHATESDKGSSGSLF